MTVVLCIVSVPLLEIPPPKMPPPGVRVPVLFADGAVDDRQRAGVGIPPPKLVA